MIFGKGGVRDELRCDFYTSQCADADYDLTIIILRYTIIATDTTDYEKDALSIFNITTNSLLLSNPLPK